MLDVGAVLAIRAIRLGAWSGGLSGAVGLRARHGGSVGAGWLRTGSKGHSGAAGLRRSARGGGRGGRAALSAWLGRAAGLVRLRAWGRRLRRSRRGLCRCLGARRCWRYRCRAARVAARLGRLGLGGRGRSRARCRSHRRYSWPRGWLRLLTRLRGLRGLRGLRLRLNAAGHNRRHVAGSRGALGGSTRPLAQALYVSRLREVED
ncbi:MAG TPA: hypothetical protein VF256_14805 [Streptosporangiaceae bacterium]